MHASRAAILPAVAILATACAFDQPSVPPPGTVVYVSDEDSGRVAVIDVARDSLLAWIQVGMRPRGVQASQDRRMVFVAVSGAPRGGPGIDESKLPPPDTSADGIAVVDAAARRLLRTLPGGLDPEAFALDGGRVYVSNENGSSLSIVDTETGSVVRTIPVGGEPEGVAVAPDGREVWVTSEDGDAVYALGADSGDTIAVIPVGQRSHSIAFLPDGSRA